MKHENKPVKKGVQIVWRCRDRLKKGKKSECRSRTVYEKDLQKAVVKAV